jgi:hypothetical protein
VEPSYWWFWMQSIRTQSLLISPTGRFALICGSLESLKPRKLTTELSDWLKISP